jgi:hypothetical protein
MVRVDGGPLCERRGMVRWGEEGRRLEGVSDDGWVEDAAAPEVFPVGGRVVDVGGGDVKNLPMWYDNFPREEV